MKKKIEIEVDIPPTLDPVFIKYLSMLDDYTMGLVMGTVIGTLRSRGLISSEESSEFTRKLKEG